MGNITELPNGFIGVQVPEGAASFRIEGSNLSYEIEEADWIGDDMRCIAVHNTYNISLPHPCEPIGMVNGLSEEQKAEIVELSDYLCDEKYENYTPIHKYDDSGYNTASESFDSLCKRHKLNPNTTFILKRKN